MCLIGTHWRRRQCDTPAPSLRTLRPEASVDFDCLIASCLEKDRARRPASAAAVADALRRVTATGFSESLPASARGPIRGIAVLPFRNISQDPTQDYFADAMTEAVIIALSAPPKGRA